MPTGEAQFWIPLTTAKVGSFRVVAALLPTWRRPFAPLTATARTSDSNMPGAAFSGGPNMMMPSTCTLLRILTHQLFRPQCATSLVVAAIIQMEKWLHCANGLLATTVINTYALPPDVMHTTCLANPKCTCVGMRLKNDESGGGILGKAGGWDGYFRLARPSACARDTCHCSRQMNRSRRPGPQLKTVN